MLLAYGLRFRRHDPRVSRWPPLLPLAAIAAAGAPKDFCVASGRETPVWLTALLLASVGWFLVSSWLIWREFRREGEAWVVAGHFFDDIGRSGQVSLAQVLPGASITLSRTSGESGPDQLQAEQSAAESQHAKP